MASEYAKLTQEEEEEEEVFAPLSPISECFNSSIIPLTILAVLEFEVPIDKSHLLEFISNEFVPCNIRLSCIVDTDKNNRVVWKKVRVRCEDHIIIPTFPEDLSPVDYEQHFREYLSKIGGERFPERRPLWEFHLVKYPTLNAAATVVAKLSHALGDGYSFIGVLFKALHRADDSSLPLTFPSLSLRSSSEGKGSWWSFVSKCMNTAYDGIWCLLKATVLEDPRSVIRSGACGPGFMPIDISSITLPLEQVKQVKSKVGGTVNDVITGLVSYMIHIYMLRMGQISRPAHVTFLVMFNMRMLRGNSTIEEILKANVWGNHSRPMHLKIALDTEDANVNPLDFIIKAKDNMLKKKNSLEIIAIDPVIKIMKWIKGQKGLAKLIRSEFMNASTGITSVIGPREKLAMMNHPISSFYYIVAGVPASLVFTAATCMDQLKLVATMEKGFINSKLFAACMNEAFEKIYEAACEKDDIKGSN